MLSISSPHHQLGCLSHLPQGLTFILIPLSFKLPLRGGYVFLWSHSLDHFGHHALSCKNGSDVVSCHNRIRDTLFEFCQCAHLGAQLEAGSSLGHEAQQTCPADILIPNWGLGKPAAIDLCVTFPVNSETLQVAYVIPSSAAMQAEQRKHHSNDAKCGKLGWVCIPLVVDSLEVGDQKLNVVFPDLLED